MRGRVSSYPQPPWYLANQPIDGRAPGGEHWGELIEAARRAQVALATANPPDEVVLAATRAYREVAELMEPFATVEWKQAFGRRPDLVGVGQSHRPAIRMTEVTHRSITGVVHFDRTYLGAGGAVHGGVLGLLFDDFFGVVAHVGGQPAARTAYLHLDYRALTPIDTDLIVTGEITSEQGRKRIVTGELRNGDVICAEAEGLFIQLEHHSY
ncbi:MAG: PaaI family thioesterase [Austwickia sp.]|nr:PaaI family thioesterase [Austwickia sp.]